MSWQYDSRVKIKKVSIDSKDTRSLVVSDIHLRLPKTDELMAIEQSLVERISKLNKYKHAVLVLNGDVFEMWEQTSQSAQEIIDAYQDLTKAIAEFANTKGHTVYFTVGNHDEKINQDKSYLKSIQKSWHATVCDKLLMSFENTTIMFEHGHEYDPYNQSSTGGATHGRELVQKTLPKLQKNMPTLFNGINDVINRGYLPSFVLSGLVYGLIVRFVFPLTLVVTLALYFTSGDKRLIWAFLLVWLMTLFVIVVVDSLLRFIAHRALGGGSHFMKNIDKSEKKTHYDYLALGHTHLGGVWDEEGYVYANSGCNDRVALERIGWLGVMKFDYFLKLGGLEIDFSKKRPLSYHQELRPLVK